MYVLLCMGKGNCTLAHGGGVVSTCVQHYSLFGNCSIGKNSGRAYLGDLQRLKHSLKG